MNCWWNNELSRRACSIPVAYWKMCATNYHPKTSSKNLEDVYNGLIIIVSLFLFSFLIIVFFKLPHLLKGLPRGVTWHKRPYLQQKRITFPCRHQGSRAKIQSLWFSSLSMFSVRKATQLTSKEFLSNHSRQLATENT